MWQRNEISNLLFINSLCKVTPLNSGLIVTKWTCRVLCTRLHMKWTGDMAWCQRSLTHALMSLNDVIDDVIMWCWDAITSTIKGRVHASDIRTAHSCIRGEKRACLMYVTVPDSHSLWPSLSMCWHLVIIFDLHIQAIFAIYLILKTWNHEMT